MCVRMDSPTLMSIFNVNHRTPLLIKDIAKAGDHVYPAKCLRYPAMQPLTNLPLMSFNIFLFTHLSIYQPLLPSFLFGVEFSLFPCCNSLGSSAISFTASSKHLLNLRNFIFLFCLAVLGIDPRALCTLGKRSTT